MTVYKKERGNLGEQPLGHAIEEHEQDAEHHLTPRHLGDKGDDHPANATPQLTRLHTIHTMVGTRTRQNVAMPKPQGNEQPSNAIEHQAPRILDGSVAEDKLQITSYHHKHALTKNGGKTVEGAAYTHKHGLFVVVQLKHVVTVCSNVVGGTAERHEGEKAQSGLEPETGLEGERHAAKRGADEQLHGHNPPTLGLHQVNKRTPQGLDDPWQIKPTGVERDFGIAESQLLVEHQRDSHYCHIGQALGKIE